MADQASRIARDVFGRLPDGRAVDRVVLRGENGFEARIIALGASLQALIAPDAAGQCDDVVLGYDDLAGYVAERRFFGAIVGRYANRIANGTFTLDGKTYTLPKNDGPNTLHGGIHKTFDIKYINLGPLGIHYAWPETHDHAKWAITKDHNWVCVGDINRMISQRKRGGGAVAFQNPTLWTALSHTDLLLAPPGHTRDEARALIHATHLAPDAVR